tara:strand:+ start:12314 stop:14212 length:1899 start_codon:yes stop_codon:yes gene_type:complete
MLAIVVEYDRKITEDQLDDLEKRWNPKYKPNKLGFTKSEGVRLLWLISNSLLINGNGHFERAMKFLSEHLGFETLLPSFDKACYRAHMFWEACDIWVDIHDEPLSENFIEFVHSSTLDVKKDLSDELDLPLEDVEKEINARWPGRWLGNFEENSRGCRFWDDNTWDQGTPNSVLVTTKGCINYSERGGQGFWSWSDIFGARFVKTYQAEKFGGVVKDWHFDSKNYYRLMNDGTIWVPFNAQATQRHLQVDYKLDGKAKKEEQSEVAQVMTLIEKSKYVDGMVPFCNNHDRIVKFNGNIYLNSARSSCVDPHPTPCTVEDWPFICSIIESLFKKDSIQFRLIQAHTQRFYGSHYRGKPEMGQVVILAGERGGGKTLYTNKIIGGLLGGVANCKSYLMDGSSFTSDLVAYPVWVMDDEDGAGDFRSRSKLTAQIKKVASSGLIKYNKKYGTTADVPWHGRCNICCNIDDQSLASMLPNLAMSVRDKLIACRVYSGMKFPNTKEETERRIQKELPYYARWLLDQDFSDVCNDHRFGVDAYIHPELEVSALQNSETFGFQEVIEMFRETIKKSHWQGTASQLWDALLKLEYDRLLGNRLNNTQIGRMTLGLIQQGYPGLSQIQKKGRREFRIEQNG